MNTIKHKFAHGDIVRVIANGRIARVISTGSKGLEPKPWYGVKWDKTPAVDVNNEILGGGWFDEDELEACPDCEIPDYLPVNLNETWEEQHT